MIVVIDSKLLAYYFYHRHEPVYKIFDKTLELLQNNGIPLSEVSKIVWAMDSNKKGRNKRKEVYPQYKAHRKELIKKKTPAEQKRNKEFEALYQKLEELFHYFGNPIAIGGVEADDIANIVVQRLSVDHEIVLISSDRDWVFNFTLTPKPENVSVVHLTKGLITYKNCEAKMDMPAEMALPLQVFAGIPKENVYGVTRLGPTSFKKYWETYGGDLEAITKQLEEDLIKKKNGMKLPEGVSSLRELVTRNMEVLKPVLWEDLTEDQRQEFSRQFKLPRKLEVVDNLSILWQKLFDRLPIFSARVKQFFGVSGMF
jgi:5'-3' exonuclease